MKIGIAHFTDIHFTEKTTLDNKIASCINALKNDFYGVEKIYFILSGDIASTGKKAEYDLAKKFFSSLKLLLEMHYEGTKVEFIIVPGNHDCNIIERNTQARINFVSGMSYKSLGTDNSVIDICLTVQEDFWNYYEGYNPLPDNKLFYQICDKVSDFDICFHCINTAWLSEKPEKPGSVFFPVKNFDCFTDENHYLNIGVWHHPYNWFNPSTPENNKKEFQHFTERIAAVHFLGHEHENEFYNNENKGTGDKISLISGKVFNQDSTPNVSGFETVIIDLPTRIGSLKVYNWDKSIYNSNSFSEVSFIKNLFKKFKHRPDFIKSLDEIKIPLAIGERKQVQLSEIFIFPDLEALNSDVKILDNYQDSVNILKNKYGNCVITGEEQIGKTSLLNMLYLKKQEDGHYPLWLSGKDIKDLDLNKIIKKAYNNQYENEEDTYEAYLQLEKSQKVLLIDDYQECTYNAVTAYKLLKEAMNKFEMVVITISSTHSLLPSMQTEFKDMGFYKIKPLGYLKRNALIEKYQYLKENPYSMNEQDFLNNIKESFDNVGAILGDKLMPSYPIYILSILQSLEYKSLKLNETSFAYCYQSLILYSLHKAGVKNDDMDTYFNFLSELAYNVIVNDKDCLSVNEIHDFFAEYSKKYFSPAYEVLIAKLKASKILNFADDEVTFGYNYILYYLSAKKISDIIHTPDGKSIINKLFKQLDVERNANILVFVTHHSKDISFIEESLLNTMVILDNFSPITLALDDPFYNQIKAIANEVTKDILEINRNPKDEREKVLKLMDETLSDEDEDPQPNTLEEMNKITLPFRQSFRSIEIVGQILKNRKGSLEKPKLKEMIKELYTTGFRTISYVSEILNAAKDQIVEILNDEEISESSKPQIQEKINQFVQMSSYQACLGIFIKLTSTIGIRDLKPLYNEVATELNTPAAKLVSFSINSYYGSVTESELKTIANDLKNNPVALKILRARMKSYVYNRNLDYSLKQKYASLLNMRLEPRKPTDKSS